MKFLQKKNYINNYFSPTYFVCPKKLNNLALESQEFGFNKINLNPPNIIFNRLNE